MKLFIVALVAGGFLASLAAAETATNKPASHTERQIEGWTVQVDDRLLTGEQSSLGERGLKVLANRLFEIKAVVDPAKVEQLQQVTIWLDLNHGDLKSAQYHPSADWLREHGYPESLARCVHIPDAQDFFDRGHQNDQPWAVLHELAHAYHDQVLDFENPQIKQAWQTFKESGRYEQVAHIGGRPRKHYALTNQMEFFAEMSEAYFGMNDFFPFNRAELRSELPEVYQLLSEVWGPVP